MSGASQWDQAKIKELIAERAQWDDATREQWFSEQIRKWQIEATQY